MIDLIRSPEVIVALCGGIVTAIIWNIRLEGKHVLNKAVVQTQFEGFVRDVKDIRAALSSEILKREQLEKGVRDDLVEIKLTLARMAAIMEEKLQG